MSRNLKIGAGILCSIGLVISLVKQNHPELQISEKGLEIIGNAEGCRRDPYQCPADILTVGIGSTQANGQIIDPTHYYTDQEIAERWAKDLEIAENCVNQYALPYPYWHIPQGVYDSAVSLTFNVGCNAVRKSTFFQKIRQADYHGACNELPRWVYSKGKKLRGLEIRREKERALCLTK